MLTLISKSRSNCINIRLSRLQSKEPYQGQKGALYNHERINPPRRYNYAKCVCIKQENFKIHDTKTDKAKMRN